MRLLYLYPEEWTGRRAREVHTLATCAALARAGIEVTLVTAGGLTVLRGHLRDIADAEQIPNLQLAALTRAVGPIRSAAIFRHHFHRWLRTRPKFDWAYIIHLKAAAMLVREHVMPYAYEAHEIFAQTPQKSAARQKRLHELERHVLSGAALRVATSAALAAALGTWYAMPDDFVIVPNAGREPLDHGVGAPDGPFVYCGSIADWKGLDLVIHAARDAQVPLKIVGGTEAEWKRLGKEVDTSGVIWQPRLPLAGLPQVLAGARAGLIPTNPATPSGAYSCPMKLFDYARCGLPIVTTALPSLQSLAVGSWCAQVPSPTRSAWSEALKNFRYDARLADSARKWSGLHTWSQRAGLLKAALRTFSV
jgi:glycosyltransferase involved in cell wall biosynthesis